MIVRLIVSCSLPGIITLSFQLSDVLPICLSYSTLSLKFAISGRYYTLVVF